MVVFACNSCGTSLKKNQVDKHVFQCRFSTVSCMDCQKDFGIKEYGDHIKCISEKEKYAAVGWVPPANFNKGEKKQQAWVDTVNATLKKGGNTLTPDCRSLLQAMSKHDNVPRKKPKFINFIRNISKHRFDERTIETVWSMVEEEWKAQAAAQKETSTDPKKGGEKANDKENSDEEKKNENNKAIETNCDQKLSKREKKEARKQKQHKEEKKVKNKKTSVCEDDETPNGHNQNGHDEENLKKIGKESKKDKKKRKRLESTSETAEKKKIKESSDADANTNEDPQDDKEEDAEEDNSNQDFKWGAIIKEILLKEDDHEISMKKLQKKVFAEYYAVIGDSKGNKTKEELISKLNKKLKKQPFKVFKDSVRLVV